MRVLRVLMSAWSMYVIIMFACVERDCRGVLWTACVERGAIGSLTYTGNRFSVQHIVNSGLHCQRGDDDQHFSGRTHAHPMDGFIYHQNYIWTQAGGTIFTQAGWRWTQAGGTHFHTRWFMHIQWMGSFIIRITFEHKLVEPFSHKLVEDEHKLVEPIFTHAGSCEWCIARHFQSAFCLFIVKMFMCASTHACVYMHVCVHACMCCHWRSNQHDHDRSRENHSVYIVWCVCVL